MEDEDFDSDSQNLPQKVRKNMSRKQKKALKSKRKVANFMNRAEPNSENGSDGNDEEFGEMLQPTSPNSMSFQNLSMEDELEEDGYQENANNRLPYMRDFDVGIQYRKLNCNSVLVSIDPHIQLYFAGKALVQVVKGAVDIYGYQFGVDGNKYSVFSAKNHSSLLYIKAVARNEASADNGNFPAFLDETTSISAEEISNAQGALIIMEGFEDEWCEGMRHMYPPAVDMIGPSVSGIGPGKLPIMKNFMDKLGFQFVKKSITKNKTMEFPEYWDSIFKDLVDQFDCSVGKICPFGGKGVGKSTFVKWLTNKFLCQKKDAKVLFIDLDPGQTEFTPPGLLSVHLLSEPILGPNFTHLKDPARSLFLGTVNVSDHPISYIKGVVELFEFCSANDSFQGIPWIVNTMGFSSGLGVHFACEIIKIIRPNCVIQLNIDNPKRSFPFFLNHRNVSEHQSYLKPHIPSKYHETLEEYNFLSVKSACNRDASTNSIAWGPNARTLREMVLISYFAEKIGHTEGFNLRSVIPLKVPLDSVAIGTLSSNLSYDEIISTLNGNLIALCDIPETHLQQVDSFPQKKFITNASSITNNCIGFGIVRAYDKNAETLYIITPVNETEILLKVNAILGAGEIGLPIQFYVNPSEVGNTTVEVPFVMNRLEGTSTLHSVAQKFFIPKKVTHKALKNCLL